MQKMQENFFKGLTSQQAYETSSWNKTLSMQCKFMSTLTLLNWGCGPLTLTSKAISIVGLIDAEKIDSISFDPYIHPLVTQNNMLKKKNHKQ